MPPISETARQLPTSAVACETCKDAGWIVGADGLVRCPSASCGYWQAQAAARAQNAAQRAADSLASLRSQAGRLADCTFDSFSLDRPLAQLAINGYPVTVERQASELRRAVEAAQQAAGRGSWLYLYGPTGAGKSHLGAAACNARIASGHACTYASAPELLDWIKDGFSNKQQGASTRVDDLINIETLMLDDLGAENATDWAQETIFRIVDARYKHNRCTIVTSNVKIETINPRIASRIRDMAELVLMPISDYRALRHK